MGGTVRMVDVAKKAGVSTMTVSRVLNDGQNVTPAMQKRVFAAIKALRYQPNELARSLREQRSRQIGIIVPHLYDPFFATCAHVIANVAVEHSFSFVLAMSNESRQAEYEEACRMLRRNVDGLLIVPARGPAHGTKLLTKEFERLPIVAFDRPVVGNRVDSVLVENKQGARIGTEHLIRLGHKRIAHIGLTDILYTMKMRHLGYNAAMTSAGLKPVTSLVSAELDDTIVAVRTLLKSKQPPTAFFCANNLTTRNVLHALQALNIHPPDRVALVGFDDFETADLIPPGITVVRQPVVELARTAAELLFTRLLATKPSKSLQHRVLPVELVVRGSCGHRS